VSRLIRAELLKIWTTKVAWGMLGLTVAFVLLNVVVLVALAGVGDDDGGLPSMSDPDMVRATYSSGTAGILFMMILGIMGISGEYRHRTITQAFLTTPRRERVMMAKLVGYALAGAAAGVISVLLTVAIALPAIELKDGPASPLDNGVPTVLAGTVLATALYALVGLGLGSLLRNQVAAIVVAVGWVQLVEGITVGALPEVGRWLPGGAVQAIVRADIGVGTAGVDELLPAWGGAVLLLGYGLVFAAVAALTTIRRDIT
jgi:ABC-type transport system involved in multi-copper enzyme maturation permease subunit